MADDGFCVFLMVFFSLEMVGLALWLLWWTVQRHRADLRRTAKKSYHRVTTEGDDVVWKQQQDEPIFQQQEAEV